MFGGYMEHQFEKKYEVIRNRLIYQMPKELDQHVQLFAKLLGDMMIQDRKSVV